MIERQVCSLRFVSPEGFSPEYRNQDVAGGTKAGIKQGEQGSMGKSQDRQSA
jgi:hypothetical protein